MKKRKGHYQYTNLILVQPIYYWKKSPHQKLSPHNPSSQCWRVAPHGRIYLCSSGSLGNRPQWCCGQPLGSSFQRVRGSPAWSAHNLQDNKTNSSVQGEHHSGVSNCKNKNPLAKQFTLHEFIGPVNFIFSGTDEPHQHGIGFFPKSVLNTFSEVVSRIRLLFNNTSEFLYSWHSLLIRLI